MANRVTVELKGLKELVAAMEAFPQDVKRGPVIYRALHDGARVMVPVMKSLAPVLKNPEAAPHREPGAIRANITQHASKHEKYAVVIRVRTRGYIFGRGGDSRRNPTGAHRAGNPNYWWLVEFGTSKTRAQPFLRPGFEQTKQKAANVIQLSLLRGVLAVAQKLGFDVRGWV